MKTIAITIDEKNLKRLKELEEMEDKNRSELVREALTLYLGELERRAEEEKETKIFKRNRKKLQRQAEALIREQKKS